MGSFYPRLLSESRIIADDTDDADFKGLPQNTPTYLYTHTDYTGKELAVTSINTPRHPINPLKSAIQIRRYL